MALRELCRMRWSRSQTKRRKRPPSNFEKAAGNVTEGFGVSFFRAATASGGRRHRADEKATKQSRKTSGQHTNRLAGKQSVGLAGKQPREQDSTQADKHASRTSSNQHQPPSECSSVYKQQAAAARIDSSSTKQQAGATSRSKRQPTPANTR